jgi:hypothetical protein
MGCEREHFRLRRHSFLLPGRAQDAWPPTDDSFGGHWLRRICRGFAVLAPFHPKQSRRKNAMEVQEYS